MKAIDGGIRISVEPAAAISPAENGFGLPARVIEGSITAATAAESAGPTQKCRRGSSHQHRRDRQAATALADDRRGKTHDGLRHPDRSKIIPASTNTGMAISGYLEMPA